MKKITAVITALALTLTMLAACSKTTGTNSEDQSSSIVSESVGQTESNEYGKEVNSAESSGSDGGNESIFDASSVTSKIPAELYKPAEGEHRFEDILNDIEQKKTMSIKMYNGYTDEMVTAFSDDGKNKVFYGMARNTKAAPLYSEYEKEEYQNVYKYYYFTYYQAESDGITNSYCYFDPKLKTYYIDNEVGGIGCVEPFNSFNPKKWSFVSSGTDEINGSEYYVETYKVTMRHWSLQLGENEYEKINIAFNSSGEVVFIGAEEKNMTFPEPFADLTSNEIVLGDLFGELYTFGVGSDAEYQAYRLYVCLIREAPFYDQYMDFSISSSGDSGLFDLSGYTEVSREDYAAPYMNAIDEQISKKIDEELGL